MASYQKSIPRRLSLFQTTLPFEHGAQFRKNRNKTNSWILNLEWRRKWGEKSGADVPLNSDAGGDASAGSEPVMCV